MYFDLLIDSLSVSEQNLVKEIYPSVKRIVEHFTKRTVGYTEWSPYDTISAHTRRISYYKDKIDRIVNLLGSGNQKLENVVKNFSSCKKERNQNIEKLREISKSMITVRMVSNIVKTIAGSFGLVGGVAIIGSLLFKRPAHPPLLLLAPSTGSYLAIKGAASAYAYAFVNTATCLAELVLTDWGLSEADKVIAKDRNLLEQMGVFEFFDELNDAIDDLFNATVSSRILSDLIDFFENVPQYLFGIEYLLPDALFLCLSSILPNITEFLLIGTSLASVILSILFVVVLTWRRVCLILKHRLPLSLVYADDARMDIFGLISSAVVKFSGLLIFKPSTAKILIGAIATVGIALNITCIIQNFIDSDTLAKCVKKMFNSVVTIHWTEAVVNAIPRNTDHQPNIQQILPDDARVGITVQTLLASRDHCQSGFPLCSTPSPKKATTVEKYLFVAVSCLLLCIL